MSYKAGIVKAIEELKDRTGSSSIAIKKQMQAYLPKDKAWSNSTFHSALKKLVADGDLVRTKSSYKLSPEFKAKEMAAWKAAHAANSGKNKKAYVPALAPKKKAFTKKKLAPKKKVSTKKRICNGSKCPTPTQEGKEENSTPGATLKSTKGTAGPKNAERKRLWLSPRRLLLEDGGALQVPGLRGGVRRDVDGAAVLLAAFLGVLVLLRGARRLLRPAKVAAAATDATRALVGGE